MTPGDGIHIDDIDGLNIDVSTLLSLLCTQLEVSFHLLYDEFLHTPSHYTGAKMPYLMQLLKFLVGGQWRMKKIDASQNEESCISGDAPSLDWRKELYLTHCLSCSPQLLCVLQAGLSPAPHV